MKERIWKNWQKISHKLLCEKLFEHEFLPKMKWELDVVSLVDYFPESCYQLRILTVIDRANLEKLTKDFKQTFLRKIIWTWIFAENEMGVGCCQFFTNSLANIILAIFPRTFKKRKKQCRQVELSYDYRNVQKRSENPFFRCKTLTILIGLIVHFLWQTISDRKVTIFRAEWNNYEDTCCIVLIGRHRRKILTFNNCL